MAEVNVCDLNGNTEASPCTTFVASILDCNLMQKSWLYSRLVTLRARRAKSAVAAPGPAPTSRTCSPRSEPSSAHGSHLRSVRFCHNREAQNQFSRLFMLWVTA